MTLRADFIAFDERLVKAGVPPLTAWWREGIGRWLDVYEAGGALDLTAAVGRGAAKSTAIYKLATFFTLFGDFDVPAGERHWAIVLSRLKEEASKGIEIIDQWLTLLGVPHVKRDDVIELANEPRGIRVVAASVAASSGWRAYFVGKDERSKWPASGIEERDAEEIDTSAGAMTATHARAPSLSFGSAFGAFGAFYESVTAGTTADRHVLGPAATWVAAPHIREEDLRRKERDPRRFAREYACEFQAAALAAFDADAIARAFALRAANLEPAERVLILDPSSGKSDTWAFGICGWSHDERGRWIRRPDGTIDTWPHTGEPRAHPDWRPTQPPILRFDLIDGIEGAFWETVGGDEIVDRLVALARKHKIRTLHADQRESLMLRAAFDRAGLRYVEHPWTNASKTTAVETVRRWLRDHRLSLPSDGKGDRLRQEMLAFEERLTPGGQFTFRGRGSSHDDYVALLITAAIAEAEVGLPLSPNRKAVPRLIGQERILPF